MTQHEKINYLEFPAKNIVATKAFFSEVFGWKFEDFGPEYTAFSDAGIEGGFYQSDLVASTEKGSVLTIFYSSALESTLDKVRAFGAPVIKEVFSFPGGRRFHFADPNGNEFAVWTDMGL